MAEIGATVPKQRSARKQRFTQHEPSVFQQLDGAPLLRGRLRGRLRRLSRPSGFRPVCVGRVSIRRRRPLTRGSRQRSASPEGLARQWPEPGGVLRPAPELAASDGYAEAVRRLRRAGSSRIGEVRPGRRGAHRARCARLDPQRLQDGPADKEAPWRPGPDPDPPAHGRSHGPDLGPPIGQTSGLDCGIIPISQGLDCRMMGLVQGLDSGIKQRVWVWTAEYSASL